VKPSFSGTWKVTATPAFQGSPLWELSYKDGVATLTEPGFADPIDYVGTIEGKVLKVSGSYDFGSTYDITITATFEVTENLGAKVPPDVFNGEYIASVGGIPLQVHQIQGVKQ